MRKLLLVEKVNSGFILKMLELTSAMGIKIFKELKPKGFWHNSIVRSSGDYEITSAADATVNFGIEPRRAGCYGRHSSADIRPKTPKT